MGRRNHVGGTLNFQTSSGKVMKVISLLSRGRFPQLLPLIQSLTKLRYYEHETAYATGTFREVNKIKYNGAKVIN